MRVVAFAFALLSVFTAACGGMALSALSDSDYGAPVVVGRIEADDIKESSGLAASECQDVLWTHNDAGNEALIFAMDVSGRHMGTWKLPDSRNIDWESIAGYKDKSGQCFLLIGDIGDNDAARSELIIYRIPEPTVSAETASTRTSNPLTSTAPEILKIRYADGRHNAETLLTHPQTGEIYVVTKAERGPAEVHKFKPAFGSESPVTGEKVGTVSVPSSPEGLLTGGSFSPDGRRVMLCDKKAGYELVLPADAASSDDIWKQKPVAVDIGDRKQGEGVSYGRDGLTLYASSEKKNTPIFRISRKQ